MKRILPVDDEIIIAIRLQEFLVSLGYDAPDIAGSAEEAIALANKLKPDLIIMDIVMPGPMDGIAAAEKIRADLDIPVIFLSSYSDEDLIARSKLSEPLGYILKPFNENQLRSAIELALHKNDVDKLLKDANQMLEHRVRLRTAELAESISKLFEEIQEHKKTAAALQESEEMFRNFADQSLVGIYLIQNGLFKYVNPKFSEIFGYTVAQCIGLSFDELVYPEDLKTVRDNVQNRLSGEVKTVQYEFRGKRNNGEIVHLEIYGSSTRYNGKPAVTGTLLDITKEINLEKQVAQAQKMESIGSLAGGIAHDLNNILFPITGLSEMLLDDMPPGTPEHESMEQIYKSAQRGSDLVKQILAFSRQSNPQKLPIRIQPILKEVLKLARTTIPRSIEITSHINMDCGLVSADPTQVHQIAMNLITNAYHAVEGNGGMIKIELKEAVTGWSSRMFHPDYGQRDDLNDNERNFGKFACITVSDTGTGIDKTLINNIFDPYFTTKAQGKGTGLGLSVVHGIVKEHGGDIRVYSEPGKGTVFHVYLPLLECAKDRKPAAVMSKYPRGSERILLVDDEEPIARMEQMMLERLGYQITVRTSSPDALAAFNANPSNFDLVISDRGMPNMTGEQLAGELISIKPDIAIILCTGFSDENDERRAKAMGIKGFLMKPVATGDLAVMVRKVLDKDALYEPRITTVKEPRPNADKIKENQQ